MGDLRELDNHLNSDPPADKSLQGCLYTTIKCPLSCAGCEKGVCRKDIKAHVNDMLLGHVIMQNAQMESVKQQLQGMSTQFKMIREDKESLKLRVAELETKVSELRSENRKLNTQNEELEREIKELKLKPPKIGPYDQTISRVKKQPHTTFVTDTCIAEFTMTDSEEYQNDNNVRYLPNFYTHTNGYKICLSTSVNANGEGSGRSTHLSVFLCLMRGEFDDQLKWPFRGKTTIKLVNQEEDKDYVASGNNELYYVVVHRKILPESHG